MTEESTDGAEKGAREESAEGAQKGNAGKRARGRERRELTRRRRRGDGGRGGSGECEDVGRTRCRGRRAREALAYSTRARCRVARWRRSRRTIAEGVCRSDSAQ
jgi:hypothetical protein